MEKTGGMMFEYRKGAAIWLNFPMVKTYRAGAIVEYLTRDIIINAAEIETIKPADTVQIGREPVLCSTMRMRSGEEVLLALPVESIWRMLTE